MNIYEALNQGDASIRETHLTSLLYYMFKETHRRQPSNSLLSHFITTYLPELKIHSFEKINVETDIKIEEILRYDNLRRDTDITIHIKQHDQLTIVNIENKIYHQAFQQDQISQQVSLLKKTYSPCDVSSILILPFQIKETYTNQTVYWYSESNSLIKSINSYLDDFIKNNSLSIENQIFIRSCIAFLNSFENTIEQDNLNIKGQSRGPKNILRQTMFEYLTEISNNWDNLFPNKHETVTVQQLLDVFNKKVCNDIIEDFPEDSTERIAKFRRGALEAQPKIATINERNRIHFNVTNNIDKQLFYYPDAPDGNLKETWKNTRIKPLSKMHEKENYIIFWKNLDTNNIEETIFNKKN